MEGLEIFEGRAGPDRGQRHRQRALRRVEADLERRVGAHRQADQVRFRDSEMIEHGERVSVEVPVVVDLGGSRHIRRRIAARRIGDTAVAARKWPQASDLSAPFGHRHVLEDEFLGRIAGAGIEHILNVLVEDVVAPQSVIAQQDLLGVGVPSLRGLIGLFEMLTSSTSFPSSTRPSFITIREATTGAEPCNRTAIAKAMRSCARALIGLRRMRFCLCSCECGESVARRTSFIFASPGAASTKCDRYLPTAGRKSCRIDSPAADPQNDRRP